MIYIAYFIAISLIFALGFVCGAIMSINARPMIITGVDPIRKGGVENE